MPPEALDMVRMPVAPKKDGGAAWQPSRQSRLSAAREIGSGWGAHRRPPSWETYTRLSGQLQALVTKPTWLVANEIPVSAQATGSRPSLFANCVSAGVRATS